MPKFSSSSSDGTQQCKWIGCREPSWVAMPVCFLHAIYVHGLVRQVMQDQDERWASEPPLPPPASYVYYLMVGPATVKIGRTVKLRQRINNLRTDLQYVVAIEHGGAALERERHLEFAAERIGRRENFRLSDRLKNHIESLQPQRDELIELATSPVCADGVA